MDEAYFGGRRKGRRGRGIKGKSIVFGLLERDGRVYTKVVEHVSKEELMEIIKKKTAHCRDGSAVKERIDGGALEVRVRICVL